MNIIKKMLLVSIAVMAALAFTSPAQAAGGDSPLMIDNVPNVVGIGVGMAPDYLGSTHYVVVAAPIFRYTFKGSERYIQVLATELSFNLLNHPNFFLGPVVNSRPGRDDVENSQVDKMEEIDDTVDVGLMAGYVWKNKANPRHRFITSLTYYMDAGSVYNGWLVQAGARYWYPISKPIDIRFYAILLRIFNHLPAPQDKRSQNRGPVAWKPRRAERSSHSYTNHDNNGYHGYRCYRGSVYTLH